LYIVGSNIPQSLSNKASGHVVLTGYVEESELARIYASIRLSVVPLRYGAGIKGKVVEAMSQGVPIVTTSVGAEGFADAEDVLFIADDARGFADAVVQVYTNPSLARDRLAKYSDYVAEHFSSQAFRNALADEVDFDGALSPTTSLKKLGKWRGGTN
jgi:glycosyltransferase involved in cell wall biosynthesis